MSLLTDLQATLKGVVAGEAFYGIDSLELNENTVFPFVVYLVVSSPVNNTLAGASALQNARVQVNVVCDAASALESTGDAVVAAMTGGPFTSCLQLTSKDEWVAEIRAYQRVIDFSVWTTN